MRFDILTIFPEIFDSYFNTSILKRAQGKKLIKICTHNLRKWTLDRHQTTDDSPYGGGMGMIFKVDPIFKAVKDLKKKKIKKCRVIVFSPKGDKLTQKKVKSAKWIGVDGPLKKQVGILDSRRPGNPFPEVNKKSEKVTNWHVDRRNKKGTITDRKTR